MTDKKTVVKVTIGGDEYALKSDRTTGTCLNNAQLLSTPSKQVI